MILYYSGTGNSAFVADSLADLTEDTAIFIPHVAPDSLKFTGKSLVFCFPIYSWGIPPFVANFISRLSFGFIKEIIDREIPVVMVCTAGDEVARSVEMFESILKKRGLGLKAAWSVIMPNDYVLLPGFDVDSPELAKKKQLDARERVIEIADKIAKGEWDKNVVVGRFPSIKSKLIYPLFVKWGVNTSLWRASDSCIGCARCSRVCPVGNIIMKDDKPLWGRNCLSCTACYQICPVNAISYGSFTKGKGQYYCHLKPLTTSDASKSKK